MSQVKVSTKEKYLGNGMYEAEFKPPVVKGKTFADKLRNAIQSFLDVKPPKSAHTHTKKAG